jgi:hypothetical protein
MFEFNQHLFVVIHNQNFDRIGDHTVIPIDSWQNPGLQRKGGTRSLIFQGDASLLL